MLDRTVLRMAEPALRAVAQVMVRAGLRADTLTWLAFALGMAACLAVAMDALVWALVLMLTGRALDGLDGTVARLTQPTDRGAFLDIVLDFLFYAAYPLAFAWRAPAESALPAAVLLASFMGTGASFLAFAALAAKRGLANVALPNKGFYFLGGLTEGTETVMLFALMTLWPGSFGMLAYGFAALCALTIVTRIVAAWRLLGDTPPT